MPAVPSVDACAVNSQYLRCRSERTLRAWFLFDCVFSLEVLVSAKAFKERQRAKAFVGFTRFHNVVLQRSERALRA